MKKKNREKKREINDSMVIVWRQRQSRGDDGSSESRHQEASAPRKITCSKDHEQLVVVGHSSDVVQIGVNAPRDCACGLCDEVDGGG